ncbi:MAG: hypothetical protein A2046_15510 [Bacteroidetes bacterium GWA2_30_7]|nr:MAG: hypothetical protein A2046_15510 [Bacteroidetes bacterium GWA2_30_7]
MVQTNAQTKTIDSLRQVIKTAKHDTTKINAYSAWGEQIYMQLPDSAISLWKISEKIANDLLASHPGTQIAGTTKKLLASSLNNIGYIYQMKGNIPMAIEYDSKSLKIYEEISDKKGMAASFNNLGVIYYNQGDIPKTIEYYLKCLKIKEEIGDKKGMATSFNNIGMIYNDQGDIPNAVENLHKSLKIKEEIGDKKGMACSFNNIGAIYKNQGDIPKAIEYYNKSLEIQEEISDKKGMAESFNNIGAIYNYQVSVAKSRQDFAGSDSLITKAMEYYRKSLKIREEIGDKKGVANSFNNIGTIYDQQASIAKSRQDLIGSDSLIIMVIEYYRKSLKIREEIGDKQGMAVSFNNIGAIYLQKNELRNAKTFCEKSYQLSKELGFPENIESATRRLKQIYEKQGNYHLAYEYLKEEILMHDSIQNQENYKKTQKQQAKYEYEKKSATDSISNAKAMEIKNIELSRSEEVKNKQRVVIYSFIIGFLIILIFSIIIYRLFIQKKIANVILSQQKEEISAQRDEIETQRDLVTEQKEHIEEIHKEVTDSINYAERIQRSFLATKELLDDNLNTSLRGTASHDSSSGKQSFEDETNYFVFFKPKDVVSGDFYWAGKLQNGNFALATADSTGHGVPGAIMSILNIFSLEKAVESGICEPSEILNHTRKTIIERLKKDGSPDGGKDGMDASLICFDYETQKLTYSAANNPIWIIRENSLIELVHDKMPIGKHDKDQISFIQHEFELQKGDVIYTLTDGFQDQFGGPNGKKFLTKNLKQLLIANCQLSMEEQKKIIENALENWTNDNGVQYEQTDDITIMGIRI